MSPEGCHHLPTHSSHNRLCLATANVMTVVLRGFHRERGFHQQGGLKELLEGRQLQELMGMVVETRDLGCQRRWSPWCIND